MVVLCGHRSFMILVLYAQDNNHARWLLMDKDQLKFSYDFVMEPGEDRTLASLDHLLSTNKYKLSDIKAVFLAVKTASLTQVKLYTATINALAWQYNWPVVGEFYFSGHFEDLLPKLLKKLKRLSKFKQLEVRYQKQPVITISKKQAKYKISK